MNIKDYIAMREFEIWQLNYLIAKTGVRPGNVSPQTQIVNPPDMGSLNGFHTSAYKFSQFSAYKKNWCFYKEGWLIGEELKEKETVVIISR